MDENEYRLLSELDEVLSMTRKSVKLSKEADELIDQITKMKKLYGIDLLEARAEEILNEYRAMEARLDEIKKSHGT